VQGTAARQSKLFFEKSVGGKSSKGQSLKKILSLLLPCLIMFLFTAACGAGIANVHPTEAAMTDPPATSEPSSTSTLTTTATPALPEGVWSLPIYDHADDNHNSVFSSLAPTFDENFMGGTWIWKDQRGDIRRYLDPETKHLFARGQSDWDRVIVDIDLGFGYEPIMRFYENGRINALTSFSAAAFRNMAATFGQDYLTQQGVILTNPESVYGYSSWLVYRIIQGDQSDIQDQGRINGIEGTNIYLKPYYNSSNDQFVFTLYSSGVWVGGRIGLMDYTNNMFWHCLPTYSGMQYPMPIAAPSAELP